MQDKQLVKDSFFTRAIATRLGGHAAFLTLYRIRRAAFRQQSMALYHRYGQAIMPFLALFGILIIERPSLLADPLLHFWRAPGVILFDLGWALGWMALVGAWTSVHRAFIRGGALARYSRSLPLPRRTLQLVDLAMLGLSMPVLLVPFGVALWVAGRSEAALGIDGRFPLYLLLFGALTIATALLVAFGMRPRARLCAGALLATLVGAPWLPSLLLVPAAIAAIAATVYACMEDAPPPLQGAALAGEGKRRPMRLLILLRVQAALLFHRHRYDAGMRLLLSGLPLLAAWWMIVYAGKVDEARAFLHVGCALTVSSTAGYFYTLHVGGQSLAPWLRSIPFGRLRMALAAQLLVSAVTAALFAATFGALAWTFGARHAVALDMAGAAAWWLAWLVPLGLPLLQRNANGSLFKFALVVAALIIVFNP